MLTWVYRKKQPYISPLKVYKTNMVPIYSELFPLKVGPPGKFQLKTDFGNTVRKGTSILRVITKPQLKSISKLNIVQSF